MLESNIWFNDPNYVLQMVKYVIPAQNSFSVVHHSAEGCSNVTTLEEEFDKHQGHLWLRIMKIGPGAIEMDKEVQIRNCNWASFELSANCKYFAMVVP